MPRLKHIDLRNYPYMITTATNNRKPVFEDSKCADILLNAILFGRKQKWYRLLSFVIMPDHLHLIIVPEHRSISECMKSIKGFSSRQINKLHRNKGPIWQDGFYDYILDNEGTLLGRIRYIEYNPVRAGLVREVGEYKWSSYQVYANCKEDGIVDTSVITEWDTYHEGSEKYSEKAERVKEERRWLKRYFQQGCWGSGEYITMLIRAGLKPVWSHPGRPKNRSNPCLLR